MAMATVAVIIMERHQVAQPVAPIRVVVAPEVIAQAATLTAAVPMVNVGMLIS